MRASEPDGLARIYGGKSRSIGVLRATMFCIAGRLMYDKIARQNSEFCALVLRAHIDTYNYHKNQMVADNLSLNH